MAKYDDDWDVEDEALTDADLDGEESGDEESAVAVDENFNEEELFKSFSAVEGDVAEEVLNEEVSLDAADESEKPVDFDVEGTELAEFSSAEIEEQEFIEDERLISIVESMLFSTDKPVSLSTLKQAFKGTQVKTPQLRRAIDALAVEYAGGRRGVCLEEISGGYQLRTKIDNANFLRGMVKARPFKLSGPALEVMAIIAYKQPLIKAQVDEIRGVESGHLLRALMEKGLVSFAGRSEFVGKPMLYQTTRKFLEIFGLRNIKELPSLAEIDDLIPEGITVEEAKKEKLSDLTESMSEAIGTSYSQGEEELMKISSQIEDIVTTSEFFEKEKVRLKEKKEAERAQDIRDALLMNEPVEEKDRKWLEKYDQKWLQAEGEAAASHEVDGVVSNDNVADSEGNDLETVEVEFAGEDSENSDGFDDAADSRDGDPEPEATA